MIKKLRETRVVAVQINFFLLLSLLRFHLFKLFKNRL